MGTPEAYPPNAPDSNCHNLHPYTSLHPNQLRWFGDEGEFTRMRHIPGGRRPLLREGGPISYEARPSPCFQPMLTSRSLQTKMGTPEAYPLNAPDSNCHDLASMTASYPKIPGGGPGCLGTPPSRSRSRGSLALGHAVDHAVVTRLAGCATTLRR